MSLAKKSLIASALLSASFASQAITPVDTSANPDDGFSGAVGVGLNGKSGSKEEQDYNINFLGRHVSGERTATLTTDYNYGETNDVKDEDDLLVEGRWIQNNFFLSDMDWESFAKYEYDKYNDLESRVTLGTGVRWRTNFENDSGVLDSTYGASGFVEEEKAESTGETETSWRGNFYGKWVWNNKGESPFELYGLISYEPVLDDLADYRASANAGIKFGLTEAMSLHVDAQIEYDSEPFDDAESTNTEYGVKLSYAF